MSSHKQHFKTNHQNCVSLCKSHSRYNSPEESIAASSLLFRESQFSPGIDATFSAPEVSIIPLIKIFYYFLYRNDSMPFSIKSFHTFLIKNFSLLVVGVIMSLNAFSDDVSFFSNRLCRVFMEQELRRFSRVTCDPEVGLSERDHHRDELCEHKREDEGEDASADDPFLRVM